MLCALPELNRAMNRHGYYRFCTARHGDFTIEPRGGKWHPMHDGELLGAYHSPASALLDLVGGHTFSPSDGVDPSEVGLPDELAQWEFVVDRR